MRSSVPTAAGFPRSYAVGLTYLPVVLFILVALLWGARGATLAVVVGAMIAITQTVRGIGPFIGSEGIFDDPVLTAQGYAVALSIAGLLVATMVEGRRLAKAQPQAEDSPRLDDPRESAPQVRDELLEIGGPQQQLARDGAQAIDGRSVQRQRSWNVLETIALVFVGNCLQRDIDEIELRALPARRRRSTADAPSSLRRASLRSST